MAKFVMMEMKYAYNAEDKIMELSEAEKLKNVSSRIISYFAAPHLLVQ